MTNYYTQPKYPWIVIQGAIYKEAFDTESNANNFARTLAADISESVFVARTKTRFCRNISVEEAKVE